MQGYDLYIKINIYNQMIRMQTVWSFSIHGQTWVTLFLIIITLIQISQPVIVTGQPLTPEVNPAENNKSVATIMGVVILMFLFSGFLSLYSAKCTERRHGVIFDLTLPTDGSGRPSQNNQPSNGLNQEVIDTFPTFLYSNVKGLKIGKSTLACAVCLNEFQDDETLRLIPKCSHVYHHTCIDIWLVSHNTCPVCRANLVPRPDDNTVPVTIQIDEEHHPHELNIISSTNEEDIELVEEEPKGDNISMEYSPKIELLRRSRTYGAPTRSKSTGFLSALLFSRSNSTGMLVQPGEDCERFTLRLPDDVRNQMMKKTTTLKRASSCVSFTRMSSGTCGYRTRSVGSGSGRGLVEYERFGSEEEEQLGVFRNSCTTKMVRKYPVRYLGVDMDNNGGERSSDLLCPK